MPLPLAKEGKSVTVVDQLKREDFYHGNADF